MATAKIVIKQFDENDKPITTTISNISPTLNSAEGFQIIDTASRAIVTGATSNTYNDTEYQLIYSVNEELGD